MTGKLELVMRAKEAGTPIICSMGAGNKLDASGFKIADIYKTSGCPLAKVMRYECRRRGIRHLKVVFSEETPIRPHASGEAAPPGKIVPGSTAFVPSVAGLILAGEVIRDLCAAVST